MTDFRTNRGRPIPLGVTRNSTGLNFAVLSRHATAVTLVVLPPDGRGDPVGTVPLDPRTNRTGDHWHVHLDGLPDEFCYGWRVDGPAGPKHRFDPSKILADPTAARLAGGADWNVRCADDARPVSYYRKPDRYDWADDAPPLTPLEDAIVYEVHVRGFTRHPSAGVDHPGTYRGLIEKLPYLKWLGVTAIELLPVHEFDECDCAFFDPATGKRLVNFWGYNSIAFAAPKAAYAAAGRDHGQLTEFRDLVKACHREGIEVYLDVVFNHTGEGDDRGRTYNLRGLDNEIYYLMDDQGRYLNFSGTGNTVNCNHPLVRELILTCLRYWVADMHVDGFRFDLASILGRDRQGHVMVDPPAIEMIAEDGVLADSKLIAEPWDAGGAYQVGGFPFGRRWSEWNGRYRDDVRHFWRGDAGVVGALATRLTGSADLYQWSGRLPRHSVNFVTCHDGFTLNDLVSYDRKRNDANGEKNRDGSDDNVSWNGGVEGPTADPEITALRVRRAKGLMATMLLSQGVPMILAGDEFLRTQKGNNNAWCQDNELSWVDWELAEKNKDFLRFVREMIRLRRRHPVFRRRRFFDGVLGPASGPLTREPLFPPGGPVRPGDAGLPTDATGRHVRGGPPGSGDRPALADIRWHGREPYKPDFGPESRQLAFTLDGRLTTRDGDPDYHPDRDFYVALSAATGPVTFRVPPSPTGRRWRRLVDTAAQPPNDFLAEDTGSIVRSQDVISAAAFGLIVLMSEE